MKTSMPAGVVWTASADWPAGVHARFTTRQGGVSAPPYDGWNLGDHVHDDADCVARNRAALAQSLGVRPVFMQQVHGVDVLPLQAGTPDGQVADACWTDAVGVACTVMVADCLPVLLSSGDGRSVAAAHAGWRGLAGSAQEHGVLEALFQAWPAARSVEQRVQLRVWLGPGIGPQHFEVGDEVRQAFVSRHPEAARCFVPVSAGKFLCDLPALARQRLQALGVVHIAGNDGSPTWCTVSQPSEFFSHRRDAACLGATGRMAACVWRVAGGRR